MVPDAAAGKLGKLKHCLAEAAVISGLGGLDVARAAVFSLLKYSVCGLKLLVYEALSY